MILEPRQPGSSVKKYFKPSFLVHGGGVVLGTVLLLLQPDPFVGAAQNLNRSKRSRQLSEVKQALESYVEANDALPPGKDLNSWLVSLEKQTKRKIYRPKFVRFDRWGRRTQFDSGLKLNAAAVGRPFKDLAQQKTWVIGWERPSPLEFFARENEYSYFGTRRPRP
jgi:hypothetical protein